MICAVYLSDTKRTRAVKSEKLCRFRLCDIYTAVLSKPKRVRRCAKLLAKSGISRVVCGKGVSEDEFLRYGMTVFNSERARTAAAAAAALAYADFFGSEKAFLIRGGTRSEAGRCAYLLLRHTRHVFLDNLRFDETAEDVFAQTGAVIAEKPDRECVSVFLGGGDSYVGKGENVLSAEDFDFSVDDADFGDIPCDCAEKLISALIAVGVISANEVKIRLKTDK